VAFRRLSGVIGIIPGFGPLIVLFQPGLKAAPWRIRLTQATIVEGGAAAAAVALAARLSDAAGEDTMFSEAGMLGSD
jgi:hypothetical protein